MKLTQIAYSGLFWTQCRVTRDLFTDLTSGKATVRTFLPRVLTAASRIQNCTFRNIITHQTPKSNLPIVIVIVIVVTIIIIITIIIITIGSIEYRDVMGRFVMGEDSHESWQPPPPYIKPYWHGNNFMHNVHKHFVPSFARCRLTSNIHIIVDSCIISFGLYHAVEDIMIFCY